MITQFDLCVNTHQEHIASSKLHCRQNKSKVYETHPWFLVDFNAYYHIADITRIKTCLTKNSLLICASKLSYVMIASLPPISSHEPFLLIQPFDYVMKLSSLVFVKRWEAQLQVVYFLLSVFLVRGSISSWNHRPNKYLVTLKLTKKELNISADG